MLTIIVKGTNGCNLACSYCSLGKKVNPQIIDGEKLVEIFRYGCKLAIYRQETEILFILHGGEPTLIDPDVYAEAIERIKKEFPNIKKQYAIQTNAWHQTDEWLEFYKKYQVTVGVSIDGSKKIHDAERLSNSGEKTYDKITEHILQLRRNDIPVSCLMVLTSNALKEGYEYLHFFEENNIHLKINPLLDYGEVYDHPELTINEGEYAKYLIRMFEYISKERINVDISPIDKIIQGVLTDGKIRECTFNRYCNKFFLCIDYNGDIFPCGKYSDMQLYKLGNIKEQRYDLLNTEEMSRLIARRSTNIPFKCQKCKYQSMCNAGCNAEASIDGDINNAPLLCTDYKILFDYFHGDGLRILKQELLLRKEELINSGV